MGATDWNILLDGGSSADVLEHDAFQNGLMTPELPRPVGDDWCRRLHNDSGAGRGHAAFIYNKAGSIPVVGDDISISLAAALAPRASGGAHAVGIGARLSSTLIAGPGNETAMFVQDGYQLTITANTSNYTVQLVKAVGGVDTVLWSDTRAGTVDVYKWFHFRLDLLVQLNGDLKLLVYENDLSVNDVHEMDPIGAVSWGTAIADIDIPVAEAYSGAAGVGFGCQCLNGSDYDIYVDHAVLQRYENP